MTEFMMEYPIISLIGLFIILVFISEIVEKMIDNDRTSLTASSETGHCSLWDDYKPACQQCDKEESTCECASGLFYTEQEDGRLIIKTPHGLFYIEKGSDFDFSKYKKITTDEFYRNFVKQSGFCSRES